jgi:hypothetical protein
MSMEEYQKASTEASEREIETALAEHVAGLPVLTGIEKSIYGRAFGDTKEFKMPTIDGQGWFASEAPRYLHDLRAMFELLDKWPHGFEWGKRGVYSTAPGEYFCTIPVTGARDGKFYRAGASTLELAAAKALMMTKELANP